MVHARFFPSIRSQEAAAELLRDQPPGEYVTFRCVQQLYFISYVSSDQSISHIAVGRLSDGSWRLVENDADSSTYPSLNAILTSRTYINTSERPPAFEATSNDTKDLQGTALSDVPDYVPTEEDVRAEAETNAAKQFTSDDVYRVVDVPPTCNHTFQTIVFALFIAVGIAGVALSAANFTRLDASLATFSTEQTKSLVAAMDAASLAAARAFHETAAADCEAVAARWRQEVCDVGVEPLQTAFAERHDWNVPFLRLLGVFVVCTVLSIVLFGMHTGSKTAWSLTGIVSMSKTTGISMRTRWSMAFISLSLAVLLSGYFLASVSWHISAVPDAVSKNTRAFTVKSAAYSNNNITVDKDSVSMSLVNNSIPWRTDVFGAAAYVHGLSSECVEQLNQYFSPIGVAPAVLRIPLFQIAESRIASFLLERAARNSPVPRDCFDIADPMPSSWLWQQWLDGINIIVPNRAGVSRTIIAVATAVIIAYLVGLIGSHAKQEGLADVKKSKRD